MVIVIVRMENGEWRMEKGEGRRGNRSILWPFDRLRADGTTKRLSEGGWILD
jgi:hypothetical protein